jgi:hypothetical protein
MEFKPCILSLITKREKKLYRQEAQALAVSMACGETGEGTCYAAAHALFPNLFKIGVTTQTAQSHLLTINDTALPGPFVIICEIKTEDPFELFRRIEESLESWATSEPNWFHYVPASMACFEKAREIELVPPTVRQIKESSKIEGMITELQESISNLRRSLLT